MIRSGAALLEDLDEIILVYFAFIFTCLFASSVEHLHQLFFCHSLSKLLSDHAQVVDVNELIVVNIKQLKSILNLSLCVVLTDLLKHDVQELSEINSTGTFLIVLLNQKAEFVLLGVHAQSSEGNLELFGLNSTTAGSIKEVEGVLNFFFLVFIKLLLVGGFLLIVLGLGRGFS